MKTHRTRNLLATLALTTGAWLLAPGLRAATPTWDGTTDMNWTQPDSTSWSGATYNGSADTAVFAGAGQGTVAVQGGGVTPGAMSISSGSYTFTGGSIGGSFYLDLTSTGTTRFAGTNTFVGTYHSLPVSVISKPSWSSNVIEIANANSLGSGAILCSGYGTTTIRNTSGSPLTLPNRWGGDWWLNSGSGAVDGADMEMSGEITTPGGGGNSFGITVKGASQTLTLSGNITCGLGLKGPGTVKLTSTNAPGIASHGLSLTGQGASGTGVKLLLGGSYTSADTYFGTGHDAYGLVSIQADGAPRTLGGPVRFYPYSQTVQFTGSNKLTFTGNAAATYNPNGSGLTLEVTDPAGVTQFNGNWTIGSCPIKKAGPGTLVLNGTMSGSNGVQVNGGTLAGTGTLPNVTVTVANGATIAPGNSAGTLTVPGSLILNNTTNLAYELGDPLVVGASDRIVAGGLTLDGILNLTALSGFGIPAGAGFARYSLISYASLTANNGLVLGTNPGGPFNYVLGFTAGVGAGAGDVFLMIPEPASFLLVGAAGLLLIRRRR